MSRGKEPLPLWVKAIPQQIRDLMESVRGLIRREREIEELEIEEVELLQEILNELRARLRRKLAFSLSIEGGNVIKVRGVNMTSQLAPGQQVPASVSPVKADGSPSTAVLSAVTFSTSDSTIATVAADPANPNGCLIASVAVGSAVISSSATATEPDGTTTETIVGSLTIIVAVPPPAPAAALVFTVGAPVPVASLHKK